MGKVALISLAGFSIGAIVGFIWAGETKKSLADNIATNYDNGNFTVSVNVKQAAAEGFVNLLR